MQTKTNPANFFLNSLFFFLLFLIPFSVVRFYFYFNYYFPKNSFVLSDFLMMLITGVRFDLCVVGFLLFPIYALYFFSYLEKIRSLCLIIGIGYKVIVLLVVYFAFLINIPFLDKNLPFDLPYWMHWPDYQSLFGVNCRICFWEYDYLAQIQPLQVVSGLIFLLIVWGANARWEYFSDRFNWKREVLFFLLLALMARGKLGEYHLRYEDSVWHNDPLINSLSNNPLWLIDKVRN